MGYKLWAVRIGRWDGKEYVKVNNGSEPRVNIEQ